MSELSELQAKRDTDERFLSHRETQLLVNLQAKEIERLRAEVQWKTEYVVHFRALYGLVAASVIEHDRHDTFLDSVVEVLHEHRESRFAPSGVVENGVDEKVVFSKSRRLDWRGE